MKTTLLAFFAFLITALANPVQVVVKAGSTSNIIRFPITLSGKFVNSGIAYNTTGMRIVVTKDLDAGPVATYLQSGSNIEDITTCGTFVAPSTGKCRLRLIPTSNGIYELQLDNSLFANDGRKNLWIAISDSGGTLMWDVAIRVDFAYQPTIFQSLTFPATPVQ